jgi:predicted O-linked N-acetylglucosamine transferase (SPINDLY family)
MNSIIDSLSLGLPGVCLDGAEAHAHADTAFFRRLGLPDDLIAEGIDDYVAAATRLINDKAWRTKCRATAAKADLKTLFVGDERLFSEAVYALVPK